MQDQPGCAVQSGDKPAAVHFVIVTNPEISSHPIDFMENNNITQRNSCNLRAGCEFQQRCSQAEGHVSCE
jgi:hypothetical protein